MSAKMTDANELSEKDEISIVFGMKVLKVKMPAGILGVVISTGHEDGQPRIEAIIKL